MALIVWKSEYNVGNPQVDREHRLFIELANRCHAAVVAKAPPEVIRYRVGELIRYGRIHFANEERLLRQIGYPRISEQETAHRRIMDQLNRLQRLSLATDATYELLETTAHWFLQHTQKMDRTAARLLKEQVPRRAGA